MNYADEKRIIETFIATNWTECPITFENVAYSNEVPEWIRVSVISGPAAQVTMGDDPAFRVYSKLVIQVFTRKDTGSGRAVQLADIANEMFRNLSLDSLQFRVPQVTRYTSRAKDVGEWFQMNVSVEFYRSA